MKKIVYILILIIGINFTSFAQTKSATQGEPIAKLIKPYPIPATTAINFEFLYGYDKTFSLQIYNFMGKKVNEFSKIPPRMTMPLDDFYRGIYVYQLRDKDGKIIDSGKFQVVK
ncbi:MAG: T9SS type A sorting domain-containing protein [Saprospiraceae bacterium]|nr:T9SS type A sorting domain-containing protein [Candidatus Brachybacter algidus]